MKSNIGGIYLFFTVMIISVIISARPVSAASYSIADLGTGPFSFNDSGQPIPGINDSVAWNDTPYNKSTVLNLMNSYFAPDYSWGSAWYDAIIFDINDSSQAVGTIIYSSVNYSFLLDGSKISIFGDWSVALGINNYGQIVGENGNSSFYLTESTLLSDINDFIPQSGSIYFSSLTMPMPSSEVVIRNNDWERIGAATDINDFGQIIGVGNRIGKPSTYYLLTPDVLPVPEPSTFILMVAGLFAFAFIRRKRN